MKQHKKREPHRRQQTPTKPRKQKQRPQHTPVNTEAKFYNKVRDGKHFTNQSGKKESVGGKLEKREQVPEF